MFVRDVGDGPVVVEGESPHGVAKVIVTAPLSLYALGSREARVGQELGPGSVLTRHAVLLVGDFLALLLRDGNDGVVPPDVLSD